MHSTTTLSRSGLFTGTARLPLRLSGPRTLTVRQMVTSKQGNPAPRLTDGEFFASIVTDSARPLSVGWR